MSVLVELDIIDLRNWPQIKKKKKKWTTELMSTWEKCPVPFTLLLFTMVCKQEEKLQQETSMALVASCKYVGLDQDDGQARQHVPSDLCGPQRTADPGHNPRCRRVFPISFKRPSHPRTSTAGTNKDTKWNGNGWFPSDLAQYSRNLSAHSFLYSLLSFFFANNLTFRWQ